MNLPNLLSLFRLVITIFFILLVVYGRLRLALLLFVLQALSDLLDGFLARRMDAKTNLGAYLDPLADKVMLASSYIALCFREIVPLWLVILVLARDLVISLGYLVLLKRNLKTSPTPIFISKTTTVFQMLTIVYVLWSAERGFDEFFFYVTALLTAASGLQYVFSGWSVMFRKETV
jgi:cardiolipin synthase (CMP-forming)